LPYQSPEILVATTILLHCTIYILASFMAVQWIFCAMQHNRSNDLDIPAAADGSDGSSQYR
jgi:hypothetical protein